MTPRIPSPSPLQGTSLPCAFPGQFLSLLPENLLQRAHLDFYEYPYFLQVEDPPFKHSKPPGLGGWDTVSPAVCIHGPMPPLPHSQYNQDPPPPASLTYKCDTLQNFCIVFNLWPTAKVLLVGAVELWRKDLVWIPMARRHQMPTSDTVKLVWKGEGRTLRKKETHSTASLRPL